MLPPEWFLLLLIAGTATAMAPSVPRQANEESLRSALDAITREQRFLDTNSDYYNDLRSFKYHGADADRKLDRERQNDREIDEEEDKIEFLPNDVGQLETVGNGYQDLNNVNALEGALLDYVESVLQQREPVQSVFRERERSSSRKRGNDRLNNKELAKFLLKVQLAGSPYGPGDDDEEYTDARQTIYDPYSNGGPITWSDLLKASAQGQATEMEENEREQDPNLLYLPVAERRNVNGRYPIGRDLRTYRSMAKRYPVAKRSPKPMPPKRQVTDPKVAQDLGALFGSQSTDGNNHTHGHDHEHDHAHDHDHNHDHKHESSSEAPKVSPPPKGQKENVTKLGKSKTIEVRKKSIDWSQYFGIDRRKKKATFTAGQGTQNQDDEWMLQRYYENMVENLRANDRDYERESAERNDKLEQMDSRLKNIKDLIVEEAPRYADSEDGADLQKTKDKIMLRMRVAYSLEKMRKALNDLRNNVAARMEAQKAARALENQTSNFRENGGAPMATDKRNSDSVNEDEDPDIGDSRPCPELEAIEKWCKLGDTREDVSLLYYPCVKVQACRACDRYGLGEECLSNYVAEAKAICRDQEARKGPEGKWNCMNAIYMKLQLPPTITFQCGQSGSDSCLRRYLHRYWHYNYGYPYGGRRL